MNKRITLDEIRESYDDFIDSCQKFNYLTRSESIQREKIKECEEYIRVVKSYKSQAITDKNEDASGFLFHMQCMLNAMRSSLIVWVNVKGEKYNEAWNSLIDAQEYVEVALKIEEYDGVINMRFHLDSMENAIFPGWKLYNSPGHTETIGKCSICGKIFSKCDHIEDHIYMGRLCRRVDRKIIDVYHSALVENPKDRRCIITKHSGDGGRMIDYFTWEETGEVKDHENGKIVEGIILSLNGLDLD